MAPEAHHMVYRGRSAPGTSSTGWCPSMNLDDQAQSHLQQLLHLLTRSAVSETITKHDESRKCKNTKMHETSKCEPLPQSRTDESAMNIR